VITVKIALTETSQVIEHEARNAYTKGPFYCVYATDGTVYKYPVVNIWRVAEQYGDSGRAPNDPPMPRKS
jgi:inhibitor of KinA sporulation pathway (predicted exonuclease)